MASLKAHKTLTTQPPAATAAGQAKKEPAKPTGNPRIGTKKAEQKPREPKKASVGKPAPAKN